MKFFKERYGGYFLLLIILIIGISLVIFIRENDLNKDNDNTEELRQQIMNMSLREKIGQMLIAYNSGTSFSDEFKNELVSSQVGGFIIFSDNISTFAETKNLISELQKGVNTPMFIAIDQEGGRVQRLLSVSDKKATDIFSMAKVGEFNNLDLSYGVGTIIGEEARTLGINTVFAPVLDVGNFATSSMKDRIISNNSEIVARNGIMIGKGIKDSGVIPVYKHFPGIADTTVDSHYALPVIMKNMEELYAEELIPFIRAINNQAEMIMVGHVSYPLITGNDLPASLSKEIVGDLLRYELGYDGVVITDAINMKSLTKNYTEEEVYMLGINAGVDIFLMPNNLVNTIDIIENLVNEEKVSEKQINEAVIRILKLKRKYLEDFLALDEGYFGAVSHQKILEKYS